MSTEYIPIPNAPLYEINAEGGIRTIKKQSPILPYPLGSREVKLKINDTARQSFNMDELVSELFGKSGAKKPKIEEIQPEPVIEVPTESVPESVPEPISEAPTETQAEKKGKIKKEKKKDKKRVVSSDNPIIQKIMKLKCYESIKMWKLHQNGISNADITILVNDPHDFVVVKTIEKYANNQTLQERADKVKL